MESLFDRLFEDAMERLPQRLQPTGLDPHTLAEVKKGWFARFTNEHIKLLVHLDLIAELALAKPPQQVNRYLSRRRAEQSALMRQFLELYPTLQALFNPDAPIAELRSNLSLYRDFYSQRINK